jgi:hypothetical protein
MAEVTGAQVPGLNIDNTGNIDMEALKAAGTIAPDQPVAFTYPDGFYAAINSLKYLPDDTTRVQTLTTLMLGMFLM